MASHTHTHSGILFRPNKEGNSDTCSHTDQPWKHYAKEVSQIQRDKSCRCHGSEYLEASNSQTEVGAVVIAARVVDGWREWA